MRSADTIRAGLARRLRRDSTSAEARLCSRLRSRGIDGHKFVRQQPIARYVVDFMCRERRLVIEVDGVQHADNMRDVLRDQWLREHNYRILRLWNNDVMSNMDDMLETIADALRADTPPHPVSACGGNRALPASGER